MFPAPIHKSHEVTDYITLIGSNSEYNIRCGFAELVDKTY